MLVSTHTGTVKMSQSSSLGRETASCPGASSVELTSRTVHLSTF